LPISQLLNAFNVVFMGAVAYLTYRSRQNSRWTRTRTRTRYVSYE